MSSAMMPCGHPSKLLGRCVLVCAFDCDVVKLPKCTECGSANLVKHTFPMDANGRHYAERLPNAQRCQKCGNVMHYGGVTG